MKKLFYLFLMLSLNISAQTFTDYRDNRTYTTITVGDKVWMAENLRYDTENDYSFSNDNIGRLYTWDAATYACPDAWRLPTKSDWSSLYNSGYYLSIPGSSSSYGTYRQSNGKFTAGQGWWTVNETGIASIKKTCIYCNGTGKKKENELENPFLHNPNESTVCKSCDGKGYTMLKESAWVVERGPGLGFFESNKESAFYVRCIANKETIDYIAKRKTEEASTKNVTNTVQKKTTTKYSGKTKAINIYNGSIEDVNFVVYDYATYSQISDKKLLTCDQKVLITYSSGTTICAKFNKGHPYDWASISGPRANYVMYANIINDKLNGKCMIVFDDSGLDVFGDRLKFLSGYIENNAFVGQYDGYDKNNNPIGKFTWKDSNTILLVNSSPSILGELPSLVGIAAGIGVGLIALTALAASSSSSAILIIFVIF